MIYNYSIYENINTPTEQGWNKTEFQIDTKTKEVADSVAEEVFLDEELEELMFTDISSFRTTADRKCSFQERELMDDFGNLICSA